MCLCVCVCARPVRAISSFRASTVTSRWRRRRRHFARRSSSSPPRFGFAVCAIFGADATAEAAEAVVFSAATAALVALKIKNAPGGGMEDRCWRALGDLPLLRTLDLSHDPIPHCRRYRGCRSSKRCAPLGTPKPTPLFGAPSPSVGAATRPRKPNSERAANLHGATHVAFSRSAHGRRHRVRGVRALDDAFGGSMRRVSAGRVVPAGIRAI